jgi:hypothetical protein
MAFTMNLTPSSSTFRNGVVLNLCPSGGYTNLANRTITAYVYIAGPAFPSCGGTHSFDINVAGSSGSGFPSGSSLDNPALNTWLPITATVTSATYSNANSLYFSMYVNCAPTWSGTIYVDDIQVN